MHDASIPKKVADPAATKASHDTVNPQALLDFMMTRWKPKSARMPPKVRGHQRFLARRNALSAAFPGETLIIPTGHEKVRSNDTYYRFRPGTDFYYLTGNHEADCVLVLEPRPEGGHRDLLFVEPNPGKTDSTFFTDRNKGELWVGPRLGVPESQARFVVDEARAIKDLAGYLEAVAKQARPFRIIAGMSDAVDHALPEQKERDGAFATALSEMRLIKDKHEIKELERVIASTHRGFEDVIRKLPGAKSEREVEGVFNMRARVEGNDVGYNTIAASGHHACILHWTRNDGGLASS